MKFRHDFLKALPVILCGLVLAWCGFYLLFGSSSIFTLRTLTVQQASLEQTANTLTTQRKEVEDRVVRMRPNSLDWDLVEQEAQAKLGPQSVTEAPTKSLKM